jgi:hypothetical protein
LLRPRPSIKALLQGEGYMQIREMNSGYGSLAVFMLTVLLACEQRGLGQKPLVEAVVERPANDWRVIVHNNHSAVLTAYAIRIYGGPKAETMVRDLRALGLPLVGSNSYEVADTSPGFITGADLLGAVFADGATYGDPKWVTNLLDARQVILDSLQALQTQLCQMSPTAKSDVLLSQIGINNPAFDRIQSAKPVGAAWTLRRVKGMLQSADLAGTTYAVMVLGENLASDKAMDAEGSVYVKEVALDCRSLPKSPSDLQPIARRQVAVATAPATATADAGGMSMEEMNNFRAGITELEADDKARQEAEAALDAAIEAERNKSPSSASAVHAFAEEIMKLMEKDWKDLKVSESGKWTTHDPNEPIKDWQVQKAIGESAVALTGGKKGPVKGNEILLDVGRVMYAGTPNVPPEAAAQAKAELESAIEATTRKYIESYLAQGAEK